MSDAIRDMIKSAMDKSAADFEGKFGEIMSAKMDSALAGQYDAMFGAPEAEVAEADATEVETEVEAETEAPAEQESETEE
jgi:hypothetical protein